MSKVKYLFFNNPRNKLSTSVSILHVVTIIYISDGCCMWHELLFYRSALLPVIRAHYITVSVSP